MAEFRKQPLEPVNWAGRFEAHAHRLVQFLQTPLERVSFAAGVVQTALNKGLAGLFSGHGNLLVACMKITSYDEHARLRSSEPRSFQRNQVYSERGADAFIQSA